MQIVGVSGHVDAGPVDDEGLVDGAVAHPGAAELVLLDAYRIVVAIVVVGNVVLIPMHLGLKNFASTGRSNWILYRKYKYHICYLRDVILKIERYLSHSI